MTDETIVAVFDTAEHAAAAVSDLEAAGVPASAITQHAKSSTGTTGVTATTGMSAAPARETGFWSSLFGAEPEYGHDTAVYDRSLEGGSTVVTVKAPADHIVEVSDILERHNPIDIDERATTYGVATTGASTTHASTTGASTMAATARTDIGTGAARATTAGHDETLQLAEETLAVGKRAVNRGTTRVRRYVVETPVEESVSLREETVTIERRPATGVLPVGGADFTDKVIEVTETDEEAVVSKSARVREEVVIRKDVADRTETVRDTVRREDVEITKDAGITGTTGATTTTTATTGTTGLGGTTDRLKTSV